MKKAFRPLYVLCILPFCFVSCYDDSAIQERLEKLEGTTIASINQQIAAINESVKSLENVQSSMKKQVDDNNEKMAELDVFDNKLADGINSLKHYTDSAWQTIDDWVEKDFCTLAMFDSLTQITSELKEYAISSKSDLNTKIDTSFISIKNWTTTVLKSYYTCKEVDERLLQLKNEIDRYDSRLTAMEERFNLLEQKLYPLDIVFANNDISCVAGDVLSIGYTIKNGTSKTRIYTYDENGWKSTVKTETDSTGTIEVVVPSPYADGIVTVFLDGEFNKTAVRSLNFIKGSMSISSEVLLVGSCGDTVSVNIDTDLEYHITVPEAYDWVHLQSVQTRSAMRHEKARFLVDKNPFYRGRSAILNVQTQSDTLITHITIHQLQKDTFNIVNNKYNVYAADTTITVEAIGNIPFNVNIPDEYVDWVSCRISDSLIREDGLTISDVAITISKNMTYKLRDGYVTIGNDSLSMTVKVTFEQDLYNYVTYNGYTYKTIEIGRHIWFAENLRTKCFNDGTEINFINEENDKMSTAYGWAYPDYNANNQEYGLLYTDFSYTKYSNIGDRNICPDGWHVSSDNDWKDLLETVGQQSAYKLREKGTKHWKSDNGMITNEYCFNAVAAGGNCTFDGSRKEIGTGAYWWTHTKYKNETDMFGDMVYYYRMDNEDDEIIQYSTRCLFMDLMAVRCVKGEKTSWIETLAPTNVTMTSATLNYRYYEEGNAEVKKRGFVVRKTDNTPVAEIIATGTNTFSGEVTGLTKGECYSFSPFEEYENETVYGRSCPLRMMKDSIHYNDGIYYIIEADGIDYFANNLKTDRYNDGTIIPCVEDATEWTSNGTANKAAVCSYNNDASWDDEYGKLYNWQAVSSHKLCPSGWHVIKSDEKPKSKDVYNGETAWLREIGGTHWDSDWNVNATNESGFTAYPTGARAADGTFYSLNKIEAYYWLNDYHSSGYAQAMLLRPFEISDETKETGCGYPVRCVRGESEPGVKTLEADTTGGVLTFKGEIISDGGSPLTEYGFYYGTSKYSLDKRCVATNKDEKGCFSWIVPDIVVGDIYYYKAYAINEVGGEVGEVKTTYIPKIITYSSIEYNGYNYKTVFINGQEWFAENLRTTKFTDGTDIKNITDGKQWYQCYGGTTPSYEPAWCNYDNDEKKGEQYGKLYNGYAVTDSRGLCPEGWHVSTMSDYYSLPDGKDASLILVEGGGWENINAVYPNKWGFSAINSGARYGISSWSTTDFYSGGANFWIGDTSEYFNVDPYGKNMYDTGYKGQGLSIRCVKGE